MISLLLIYSCSNPKSTDHISSKEGQKDILNHCSHQDSVFMNNGKIIVKNANYKTFDYIFDTLSTEQKNNFILNRTSKIKPYTIHYYNKYEKIESTTDLSQIYYECDIDSLRDIDLLPFNVYILRRIMQNKNVDGAIAELFSDTYYKLLI